MRKVEEVKKKKWEERCDGGLGRQRFGVTQELHRHTDYTDLTFHSPDEVGCLAREEKEK